MDISQTVVSRAARCYMREHRITQRELAELLGINQTRVSARLNGRTRWQYDEVVALADLGVPELKPILMIGAEV